MIKITRNFNQSSKQFDFFTEVPKDTDPLLTQAFGEQQVNLSRGRTRLYTLLNLSAHNGGGANWKDGQAIHTPAACKAYLARTEKDIAAAVAKAEARYNELQVGTLFSTDSVTLAECCVCAD